MVELEIDGQHVSIEEGASIIEAADKIGVYIPRFCYHKKLSIAANCRMCLVEVAKVGKPLPACATPVTQGMKVFTTSQLALKAQQDVMEFLLINHPLDCPVCDQGGVCELQDLAMGYGRSHSHYNEPKSCVVKEDIGPLIDTEMTRCINCTRCVRFGEEVAGLRELGVVGRGEEAEIGTYVKHFMHSEMSANIIDLCPVGALTAKPNRFAWRGWEAKEHPMVAPHDCVGSHVFVHTRGNGQDPTRTIQNVVPRECVSINESWISDRDRFSFLGLQHPDRVKQPMMKQKGKWVDVSWQRALIEIADRLQAIKIQQGADKVGAIMSPNVSTETAYLTQRLMRAFGSDHVDHRLRMTDFSMSELQGPYRWPVLPVADFSQLSAMLLVGSNIRQEQPVLASKLLQASLDDGVIMAVNSVDYAFNFPIEHALISADIVNGFAAVVKAVGSLKGESLPTLEGIVVTESSQQIARCLLDSDQPAVALGEEAIAHPRASVLRSLLDQLTCLLDIRVAVLTPGANATGAYLAGAIPHASPRGEVRTSGYTTAEMLVDHPLRAYLLLDVELERDSAYQADALAALDQAGLVVSINAYMTDAMRQYADFILPMAPFGEHAGSYTNYEGSKQSFSAASEPHEQSKPAWKIVRALANFLELPDFSYQTVHEVQKELYDLLPEVPLTQSVTMPKMNAFSNDLVGRLVWPIYSVDSLVRRSLALADAPQQLTAHFQLNNETAKQLGFIDGDRLCLTQGKQRTVLALKVEARVAEGMLIVPAGIVQTEGVGHLLSPIDLQKESAGE